MKTIWSAIHSLQQGTRLSSENIADPLAFLNILVTDKRLIVSYLCMLAHSRLPLAIFEDPAAVMELTAIESLDVLSKILEVLDGVAINDPSFYCAKRFENVTLSAQAQKLLEKHWDAANGALDWEIGVEDISSEFLRTVRPAALEFQPLLWEVLSERTRTVLNDPVFNSRQFPGDLPQTRAIAAELNALLDGTKLFRVVEEKLGTGHPFLAALRTNPFQLSERALNCQLLEYVLDPLTPLAALRRTNLYLFRDIFGAGLVNPARSGRRANAELVRFLRYYTPLVETMVVSQCQRVGLAWLIPEAESLSADFLAQKVSVLPESFINKARRENGRFRHFLSISVRNFCRDLFKKLNRETGIDPQGDDSGEEVSPEIGERVPVAPEDTERRIDQNVVRDILKKVLQGAEKEMIPYLMRGDPAAEMPQAEMAANLGMSHGMLRKLLCQRRKEICHEIHLFSQSEFGNSQQDLLRGCAYLRTFVKLAQDDCLFCCSLGHPG